MKLYRESQKNNRMFFCSQIPWQNTSDFSLSGIIDEAKLIKLRNILLNLCHVLFVLHIRELCLKFSVCVCVYIYVCVCIHVCIYRNLMLRIIIAVVLRRLVCFIDDAIELKDKKCSLMFFAVSYPEFE